MKLNEAILLERTRKPVNMSNLKRRAKNAADASMERLMNNKERLHILIVEDYVSSLLVKEGFGDGVVTKKDIPKLKKLRGKSPSDRELRRFIFDEMELFSNHDMDSVGVLDMAKMKKMIKKEINGVIKVAKEEEGEAQ